MSRRLGGLLALCLYSSLLAPVLRAADAEPTFLDKKLSYWLNLLESGKDAPSRRRGLLAVEQIGPANKKVLPALVKALREDKEPAVRKAAARAVGRTVARILELAGAQKEDPPKIDSARDALAVLLRTDKIPEVREAAALGIGDLGPEARAILGTLTQALKDKHLPTRKAAAVSLRRIGPAAHDAQAELQTLLADKKADKEARTDAAIALGQIAPDVSAALPVLREVLGDATAELALRKAVAGARGKKVPKEVESEARAEGAIRKAVADALRKIGKDAAEASDTLGAVLMAGETPAPLRLAAVNALDQFGAEAKPAIPALIKAVADPVLIKTMGENGRFIRGQAMHCLGQMGAGLDKERKEAVQAILKATQDPNSEVCVSGIETLATMALDGYGGLQADVVKRLESIIRREGRKSIREAAEMALAKIRPKK